MLSEMLSRVKPQKAMQQACPETQVRINLLRAFNVSFVSSEGAFGEQAR